MAHQELLMDAPFVQAELYLSKLTASHFNVLNTKSQTRTCWKGFSLPCSTRTQLFQMRISGIDLRNPYRPCTAGRLHLASWGRVTTKISLVLVHFGLIKLNQSKIHQYFQHTSSVEHPCLYSPCRSNLGQFGC